MKLLRTKLPTESSAIESELGAYKHSFTSVASASALSVPSTDPSTEAQIELATSELLGLLLQSDVEGTELQILTKIIKSNSDNSTKEVTLKKEDHRPAILASKSLLIRDFFELSSSRLWLRFILVIRLTLHLSSTLRITPYIVYYSQPEMHLSQKLTGPNTQVMCYGQVRRKQCGSINFCFYECV